MTSSLDGRADAGIYAEMAFEFAKRRIADDAAAGQRGLPADIDAAQRRAADAMAIVVEVYVDAAKSARPVVRYLRNCFWLMVPVLAFNLLFAQYLPPAFQSDHFSRDIPLTVSVPENVLRGLVFVLLVLMPLTRAAATLRSGIVMYSIGLGLYFSSWAALIFRPTGPWSTTLIGFYRRWMFVVTCVLDRNRRTFLSEQ